MCNSCVIGDMVVDVTIFVRDSTAEHQQDAPEQNQRIFEVIRRTRTGGGAANCARALAVLSQGDTYLWGPTGKSPGGSFRELLEQSLQIDGSSGRIRFRGTIDENQMNIVTRLIEDRQASYFFGNRFDEAGYLPPGSKDTVLGYLQNVRDELREKNGILDVIIINDLDMGCLTKEVVEAIARFALENEIPLFVDPKYQYSKYRNVKGVAIFPNLAEWGSLVGEDSAKQKYWRGEIQNRRDISGMLYRTLLYFGEFDYCIIKCDEAGVIFVGPSDAPGANTHCVVYHFPPHKITNSTPSHQLGCGDVMTAVFAMHFDRLMREFRGTLPQGSSVPKHEKTKIALTSLAYANVTVACYRQMHWHRMPTRLDVGQAVSDAEKQRQDTRRVVPSLCGERRGRFLAGIKYLPKLKAGENDAEIVLSEYRTFVMDWFSQDPAFRDELDQLRTACRYFSPAQPHILLSAKSGCGKTTLVKSLQRLLQYENPPLDIQESIAETRKQLTELFSKKKESNPKSWSILVVDEALQRGFEKVEDALACLQAAERARTRLLLIDSQFDPENWTANLKGKKINDFLSRCRRCKISSPDDRPYDIPLIVIGLVCQGASEHGAADKSLEIGGDFMLAFTNAILDKPCPREWKGPVSDAVGRAQQSGDNQILRLTGEHLPPNMNSEYIGGTDLVKQFRFKIKRGPEEGAPISKKHAAA